MSHKLIAMILLLSGLSLLGLGGYAYAQEDEDPDLEAEQPPPEEAETDAEPEAVTDLTGVYAGANECADCHRSEARNHDISPHVTTFSADNILGDFSQGEAIRLVQFPGESAARPFTAADIAYAVGSGQHIQRYLYAIGENEYRVFPAQWNVTAGEWETFSDIAAWDDPVYDWATSCATCHTTGFDGTQWVDSGVTCEACHGAGAEHIALVNDLPRRPEPEELQPVLDAISLTPSAETCAACHSNSHGSSLTTGHGLDKNMQYNEWLLSDHAGALQVLQEAENVDESCLTCHSTDYTWTNRQIAQAVEEDEASLRVPITLETAQFGVTCAACHNPHLAETDNFMVAEPEALCASCHENPPNNIYHPAAQIFAGLPLVENVQGAPSPHFSAEDGSTCTTCHLTAVPTTNAGLRTSHTMSPLVPGLVEGADSCTGCHSDLEADYLGEFMTEQQAKTSNRLAQLQQALTADSPAWVRQAVAAVTYDGSLGLHNTAYINQLLDSSQVTLGLVQNQPVTQAVPAQSPDDCLECHQDTHRDWINSPHANASQNQAFLLEFASQGRPTYCMSCHASGYNPNTGTYQFEGVVCSTCHQTVAGEHPPAPLTPGDTAATCGQCHSGAHAPSYDEWLVSDHQSAGIDCVDCHTPHNNGLVLGDVNATCSDCHKDAMRDQVHMTQDLTCVDCHMSVKESQDGIHVISTGHSMQIDPGVCSDCHGDIHSLTLDESGELVDTSETELLHAEIDDLEAQASNNLNTGVVGGALGMVIVGISLYLVIRFRRLL